MSVSPENQRHIGTYISLVIALGLLVGCLIAIGMSDALSG